MPLSILSCVSRNCIARVVYKATPGGGDTGYTITGGTNYSTITTTPTFKNMIQFLYSSVPYNITFNANVTAQVLLVAGGGHGYGTNGSWSGVGGGGAGGGGVGVGTIQFKSGISYTVSIGIGGTLSIINGNNTSINGSSGVTLVSETAYGGGGCPGYDTDGLAGGSSGSGMRNGGGSVVNNPAPTKGLSSSYTGIANITYYGNKGNVNANNSYGGAGGGGAGGTGYYGASTLYPNGGAGGIGYLYSYTNSYYGGGGCGGSASASYTTALAGGGGNGQGSGLNNNNASPNTGGGGGGGYCIGTINNGGNGASGLVILLFN